MGSLASAQLSQLRWIAIPTAGLIALLWSLERVLDVMSMGDDVARALDVPVTALRYGVDVILVATLASALAVSVAGMTG
jgi:ABC-type Fe3+-siderophore transport system permease subunit